MRFELTRNQLAEVLREVTKPNESTEVTVEEKPGTVVINVKAGWGFIKGTSILWFDIWDWVLDLGKEGITLCLNVKETNIHLLHRPSKDKIMSLVTDLVIKAGGKLA